MNKYYCVIFALCLHISTILCMSEEMAELAAMLHDTCVSETGVDASLIDKVNQEKVFPDDEKFKCYIKCILSQMACISDDGVVDAEASIAVLPDEMKDQVAPVIRSCGSKMGANACESAWLTHKCYIETDPASKFVFRTFCHMLLIQVTQGCGTGLLLFNISTEIRPGVA